MMRKLSKKIQKHRLSLKKLAVQQMKT